MLLRILKISNEKLLCLKGNMFKIVGNDQRGESLKECFLWHEM